VVSVGGLLGLAAWKLKRPVKLVFSREETFQATTKRHPFDLDLKIGAAGDGIFTACGQTLADAFGYRECLETLQPHYRRVV
jgi:CO/xanthine dehydrogenase Mo-binding subunit